MPMSRSRLTLEYIKHTIGGEVEGVTAVEACLLPAGTNPQEADWKPADTMHQEGGAVIAKFLTGPGGTMTYTPQPSNYPAPAQEWLRITAEPEKIVRPVQVVTFT